jgi:CRP-like cAMP-binding protein
MATNALTRKLLACATITAADIALLDDLTTDVRYLKADQIIVDDGDNPKRVHLVLDGWLARSKLVRNGGRQITAILLPGDFCDLHGTLIDELDHSITALTDATVAYIHPEQIDEVTRRSPRIARAFWWLTVASEAILRTWLVSIGRLTAGERIAHLICELQVRLAQTGMATDDAFPLPLTQEQISDIVGLTPVHTNRMLRRLTGEGLIEHRHRTVKILDGPQLRELADFDPRYLRPLDAQATGATEF